MDNSASSRCMVAREPLTKMIKSLLIRENDVLGEKFRQYLEIGKDVYRDLNLYAIREAKRYWIEVDKQLNAITLPDNVLLWSSVSIVDDCGQIRPLIMNKNLTGEIIELGLAKDCACQCGCQSALCVQLNHYEVITKDVTAPMPNGSFQVFTTTEKKTIYPNGDLLLQYTEPVVIYGADGVHTATELQDKEKFICHLQVKACGCVEDCPENRQLLRACCGDGFLDNECGCQCCPPTAFNQTYGYEQFDNKICFDSNFQYTHVLLRYYAESATADIMVPLVAKTAMLRGIKFESLQYEKGTGYTAMAIQRQLLQFERLYDSEKRKLFRLLNRFSLAQFYTTVFGIGARMRPDRCHIERGYRTGWES